MLKPAWLPSDGLPSNGPPSNGPPSNAMISVFFYTLGCKCNQLETEAICCAFKDKGFTISSDHSEKPAPWPHLCIINTCTVTSKAEQKARRIIRFYLKKNCTILVTGCYAQLEREELEALSSGLLFVVPGMVKDSLLDLPQYLAEENPDPSELSAALATWLKKEGFTEKAKFLQTSSVRDSGGVFRFNPHAFLLHSRAFLKIQDGCDRSCAYCRVPFARGKSVSLEAAELLRRLQLLEESGYHEAVLTGVNIAQYRDPSNPAMNLPSLLLFLLEHTNSIALRLSSIEPEFEGVQSGILNGSFFEALSNPRIRNHFHLSVQSGSDTILSAMGRPYRTHHIIEMIEKIRNVKNDPFLACDIITGFPGESDGDFEKTMELCRTADFAWIHTFPYSKRPNTSAALMKEQISSSIARKRQGALTEFARMGKQSYVKRWQGKTIEAIAETGLNALTDNYIRIRLLRAPEGTNGKGSVFRCSIGKESKEKWFDAWAEQVPFIQEYSTGT